MEMISLTVRGPAQRRETIESKHNDRYEARTNYIETVELEIRREWAKPHPNLDAFGARHPQAIASDLAGDLDGWEFADPSEWTIELFGSVETLVESARMAAVEWDTGTSTLDVLARWDCTRLSDDLPFRAAIRQVQRLIEDGEAEGIDHGEPTEARA